LTGGWNAPPKNAQGEGGKKCGEFAAKQQKRPAITDWALACDREKKDLKARNHSDVGRDTLLSKQKKKQRRGKERDTLQKKEKK